MRGAVPTAPLMHRATRLGRAESTLRLHVVLRRALGRVAIAPTNRQSAPTPSRVT